MNLYLWELKEGQSPLMATAIHNGHGVRENLVDSFSLSGEERLREEDPFTGTWTAVADTRVIVQQSRFEVDLNRPRGKAVYIKPEDAWGLQVWKTEPPPEAITQSLAQYDLFYAKMESVLREVVARHGRFVVFDLHTYNHRRDGPNAPPADPKENPEVNIGTGTMDRQLWGPVVDRFMSDLRRFDFLGRHLDVRENIIFQGGQFSRWIHQTFPESGCALAIEFKKFFMDEWTGVPDFHQIETIQKALQTTVPGVLEVLKKL